VEKSHVQLMPPPPYLFARACIGGASSSQIDKTAWQKRVSSKRAFRALTVMQSTNFKLRARSRASQADIYGEEEEK
jgi:hypothetical protein